MPRSSRRPSTVPGLVDLELDQLVARSARDGDDPVKCLAIVPASLGERAHRFPERGDLPFHVVISRPVGAGVVPILVTDHRLGDREADQPLNAGFEQPPTRGRVAVNQRLDNRQERLT